MLNLKKAVTLFVMIDVKIPGFGHLQIDHVVMDYNGTLATQGALADGVDDRLRRLAETVELHVVTADTFGQAREQLEGLPVTVSVITNKNGAVAKASYIKKLGTQRVITLGNGRNDRLFLETAALGIGIILAEGIAIETFRSADILCTSITDALDMLLEPRRLLATLKG